MKNLITLLLLVCLCNFKVTAQSQLEDLVSQGVKLHDKGDYDGAISLYNQALAIDSKSSLANYEISLSYFSLKNYAKAIEYTDKVINLDKEFLKEAYVLKGSAQDLTGNPKGAVKTYKKAIKKYPDSYLLYYNLALTSYNQKDYKEAEESLQKSVVLKQDHASSHLLLGYVMNDQGSRVKSLLALYNFLLLEPNSSRAKSAYTFLHEQLKKGVSRDEGKNTINISLSPSKDSDEFGAAELMLSLLESSKSLETNEGKSEMELFTENNDTFFSILSELKEKKKSFWSTFYVDFFYSIKTNNHTEALSYFISQSNDDESIQLWLKENKNKVEALARWYSEYNRKS